MRPDEIKKHIISIMGNDYLEVDSDFEIRYKCPFCEELGLRNDDYKLYVNYSTRKATVFYCQRCESTGTLKDMSDESLLESNSDEAVNVILDAMRSLADVSVEDESEQDYFLLPKNKPIPGTTAWDYIISRGITPADMSYYDIRVPDLNSDYNMFGRFVIPNKVISNIFTDIYCARSYIGDKVRYKNAKSSKKNEIVFNLHRIPDNPDRIILNEGAINSIIAGRDSIATYGKHVSDLQISYILAKNPDKFYVSLDTDARDKAEKLCDKIVSLSDTKVYLVELPEKWSEADKKMKGLDASDLGREVYQYYIDNARRYTNSSIYFIENILNSYNK